MNATNKTLLQINQEISQLQSSVVGLFLRNKVSQFYKDNGIRIDTLHKKMRTLQSEYFVVENEKIVQGEDKQPVLQEGKNKAEFEKLFEELMAEENSIKI